MAYIPLTNAGEHVVRPPQTFSKAPLPTALFQIRARSCRSRFPPPPPPGGGGGSAESPLVPRRGFCQRFREKGEGGAHADSITVGNAPSAPGPFRSYPAIGIFNLNLSLPLSPLRKRPNMKNTHTRTHTKNKNRARLFFAAASGTAGGPGPVLGRRRLLVALPRARLLHRPGGPARAPAAAPALLRGRRGHVGRSRRSPEGRRP